MCGVAGLWLPRPASRDALEANAAAMGAAIAHRGPDDAGVWSDPDAGLALAHRRLAILDLTAAGHQPMLSATGRYVIVFNGEIYNHLSIRQDLDRTGSRVRPWRGHADTETLLVAIETWGLEEALHRCAGMFALALWDRRERVLHLARDRFGEKPLYWGWLTTGHGAALVFASELAALRALPGSSLPPINPGAVAAFFRYGCIPAPLSIYSGLQQLGPGQLLSIAATEHGRLPEQLPCPQTWWDGQRESVRALAAGLYTSEQEAIHALGEVLSLVVAEQATADVPLGSFLSGGIDSSLITALLQAAGKRPVRSFTIAFPDSTAGASGFNEAPFAQAVAKQLGTDHTEIALTTADAQALIPSLPRIYSEPFADSSQLPTHLVCREARRSGLTVALSGDGGDELFGGYNRHRLAPALLRRLSPLPSVARTALARTLPLVPLRSGGLARDKRRKLAAAIGAASSLEQLHASLISIWGEPGDLLQRDVTVRCGVLGPPPLPQAPTPSEQVMLADALTYLPSDILAKVDRAAMAVGLETRAPFLDHRVAAVAWRLPLGMKLRGATGKWVLRQVLEQYVPKALVERPKAGFAMPVGAWLRGPLREWAEDLLQVNSLQRYGYLKADVVQRLWRAHLRGDDYTPHLWSVLMWQAWLEEWGA